jgi:hypothetical protein
MRCRYRALDPMPVHRDLPPIMSPDAGASAD